LAAAHNYSPKQLIVSGIIITSYLKETIEVSILTRSAAFFPLWRASMNRPYSKKSALSPLKA
jgi:hypothetical protein